LGIAESRKIRQKLVRGGNTRRVLAKKASVALEDGVNKIKPFKGKVYSAIDPWGKREGRKGSFRVPHKKGAWKKVGARKHMKGGDSMDFSRRGGANVPVLTKVRLMYEEIETREKRKKR